MDSAAKSKGARGGGVTVLGQLLKAAVQVLSVVVLSRLLGPDEFGLIAMVTVAVALGELVLDFGLTAAALRAPKISHAQSSNLFWVNTALGTALGAAMFLLAPLLAQIYNEPRIVPIAQVVALSLLFNGVQAQVQVQLARSQRFTAIVVTDLAAQTIAFLLAVVAAVIGLGYWALVIQVVTNALVIAVSRIVIAKWKPSLPRRGVGSRHLLRSGVHYALAQLLTFGSSNIDSLLIGARWGANTLGYYNRAMQLLTVPLSRLLTPLTNVAVPTMTKMNADASQTVVNRRFQLLQVLVSLPVGAIFAIAAGSANTLIPMILGDQWTPAVPLFQLLAAGGGLRALSHVTYWLFLMLAPSQSFLASSIVTKGLTMFLVLLGSFHSVEAVALLYTLGLSLNWPINLIWLKARGGLDAWPLFRDGIRILLTTCPAAIASYFCLYLPLESTLMLCAAQLTTGVMTFVLTIMSTRRGRADFTLLIRTAKRMI
ncbi:lipopolysaccharide biosynthesis protein [Brevibacterium senegalense]|uniref:lipopolysaccharide biosynthesis protein n=1 Tax=Brevibacterium senegalense TaxID=1033736 RepID=UPI0009FC9296|nr:lipopolysaccharide biosynthesis protein [Brevibacterium senegalense]